MVSIVLCRGNTSSLDDDCVVCVMQVYVQLPGEQSHVVHTSWALLTLLLAQYHLEDSHPLHRASQYLLAQQSENGDWPQQTISGVFNRNCMITYANYRNIFPLWALGMYRNKMLMSGT